MDIASNISDNGAIVISSVGAGIIYLAWFLIWYLRQAALSWKWEEALRKAKSREERIQLKDHFRQKFIQSRKYGVLFLGVVPVMHFLFYLRTAGTQNLSWAFILVIIGVWAFAAAILYVILGMKKPDSFKGKSAGFDLRDGRLPDS